VADSGVVVDEDICLLFACRDGAAGCDSFVCACDAGVGVVYAFDCSVELFDAGFVVQCV
jgi:hypothetical protein